MYIGEQLEVTVHRAACTVTYDERVVNTCFKVTGFLSSRVFAEVFFVFPPGAVLCCAVLHPCGNAQLGLNKQQD